MSKAVSELLLDVLEQIGVRQIFGLIGDSLNPLADRVRRSTIEWVGVRHEEGAAPAAAGQAKLTRGDRMALCRDLATLLAVALIVLVLPHGLQHVSRVEED